MRIYSAGIQDFATIISMGCIYADKTDLIYRMTHESQYVFLSRPRRFGKSLLCSTLEYYFQGRSDLFKGLAMEQLEHEWVKYPVLHFDISLCKNKESVAEITSELNDQVRRYEKVYGQPAEGDTPGQRFKNLIENLYTTTQRQVVVIIDEYDTPLLDYLDDEKLLSQVRRTMQEFYQVVKACGEYLRFVFITGITKFSHLSIFSTLNNLYNISMLPAYASICGITERELATVFGPDIALMAEQNGCTPDEMLSQLKQRYDGYHFSHRGEVLYNPYSLTTALKSGEIENHWFSSGTPTFLFKQMERFQTDIKSLERTEVSKEQFDLPSETMTSILPLLYQSGYLTIKDYNARKQKYTLDIPNAEVRSGLMDGLWHWMLHGQSDDVCGLASDIYGSLCDNDVDAMMRYLQSFFASVPYLELGNRLLTHITTLEAYYEVLFFVLFSALNYRVRTQVKSVRGRADVVMEVGDTLYVMELKVGGTAQQALDQIEDNGYMIPYQAGLQHLVCIGVSFSTETRTIDEWLVKSKQ